MQPDMRQPHSPPAIPYRAGLGPAECIWCGDACLAAAGYVEPQCDPCRRTRLEIFTSWSSGVEPSVDLVHSVAIRRHVEGEETALAPVVAPVKIRILEPATELDGDDFLAPRAAVRLVAALREYGRPAKLTYALAEDVAKGKLIESHCVRVWTQEGRRFGYASYVNSLASSAVLWRAEEGGPRLARGVEEFTALALGKPWSPPAPAIVAPCYACQRSVRWTGAGRPYKHKAQDGAPCAANGDS